jgi:hypothetical protein
MLAYGSLRELTDEELARAVKLDPSQIAGLGPSIEALRAILEERKRKILETFETSKVLKEARRNYQELSQQVQPPRELKQRFQQAVDEEQIYDLERLWYRTGNEQSRFAKDILQLMERLGEKYQVDELAANYQFTGRTPMSVPQALEIKEELETIDKLLKQLEEAAKTAQIGVIDLDELARFTEPGDVEQLGELQRQVNELLREIAKRQGLEESKGRYHLTPQAYRLFQSRLLERMATRWPTWTFPPRWSMP